jgi:hypothetical protein
MGVEDDMLDSGIRQQRPEEGHPHHVVRPRQLLHVVFSPSPDGGIHERTILPGRGVGAT